MPNPFVYSEPVAPEALLNRDAESAWLIERAAGSHNSRLVAPRRYGKTSLLRRVLRDLEREGFASVYVSFFGVLTPADVAERIERAYTEQLTGRLSAWFSGIRRTLRPTAGASAGIPGLAGGNVSVSLEPRDTAVLDRLAVPRKLFDQRGTRVAVVFDEFQDVLRASEQMDAVIRAEIEHHGDAASYIFAGSHVGMMRELFTSKRRAFYAQASPLDLGPLAGGDVAEYLAARFDAGRRPLSGGALDSLLDTACGHPQRTMLLAHFLWADTAPGERADDEAFDRAFKHVMGREVSDELRAVWSGLTDTQRRVITAVADNSSGLYSAATQARVGGARGGYLKQAAGELVDNGELVLDAATATGYRVIDPLLAIWVLDGRAKA